MNNEIAMVTEIRLFSFVYDGRYNRQRKIRAAYIDGEVYWRLIDLLSVTYGYDANVSSFADKVKDKTYCWSILGNFSRYITTDAVRELGNHGYGDNRESNKKLSDFIVNEANDHILRVVTAPHIKENKNPNIEQVVFDHYGARHQMMKLMEELNECAVEAAKASLDHMEDGHFDQLQLRDLASEIADVEFLFDQLRNIPDLAGMIDKERTYKENRQLKRIEEETRK